MNEKLGAELRVLLISGVFISNFLIGSMHARAEDEVCYPNSVAQNVVQVQMTSEMWIFDYVNSVPTKSKPSMPESVKAYKVWGEIWKQQDRIAFHTTPEYTAYVDTADCTIVEISARHLDQLNPNAN